MEKYKICPICGERNLTSMLECIKCETDLSAIPITDTTEYFPMPEERKPVKAVRICECGTKNLFQSRKCINCGEDISDVIASVIVPETQAEEKRFVFTSLDGQISMQISENIVVGRENAMQEYLSDKKYVSRSHALLTIENGRIMIENLSSKNYTYVNNIKIPDGKYELHNGDEIGLGGKLVNGERQKFAAYFKLEVK